METNDKPQKSLDIVGWILACAVAVGVLYLISKWMQKGREATQRLYPMHDCHLDKDGNWSYAFKRGFWPRLAVAILPSAVVASCVIYGSFFMFLSEEPTFFHGMVAEYGYGFPWKVFCAVYIISLVWHCIRQWAVWHIFRQTAKRYPKDVLPATEADARLLGYADWQEYAAGYGSCTERL